MQFFMAMLPIIVLFLLIVVFRRSVVTSVAGALALLLGVALWWGIDGLHVGVASLRGAFVALEIIAVIVSALIIIETIRRQGLLEPIQSLLVKITGDYRVQVVLVAVALMSFLEGVAGFGAPIIITVPILMALGIKPLHAVVLALAGNTLPVAFGSIGLPITYSIGGVLETLTTDHAAITSGVITLVAGLNIGFSILLVLLISGLAVILRRGKLRQIWEFIPFAVVGGLAVSVPAFLVAVTLGPELPSIIGGLVGMIIIGLLAHYRILLPHSAKIAQRQEVNQGNLPIKHALVRALAPYILLITVLLLLRLPFLGIGEHIQDITIGTDALFGTSIAYSFAPLYATPVILLICALITLMFSWKRIGQPRKLLGDVARRVRRPALALLLILIFVQIFIYSDVSTVGLSMPTVIATVLSDWTGMLWPFFAPFVGAFGAFLAGSTTVSNLIFVGLQYDVAETLGLSAIILVSLQMLGATLGNMMALHNIVAALTVAGLDEKRAYEPLRINVWILLVLLSVAGLVGLLLVAVNSAG